MNQSLLQLNIWWGEMVSNWHSSVEVIVWWLRQNLHAVLLLFATLYLFSQRDKSKYNYFFVIYTTITFGIVFFPITTILLRRFVDDISYPRVFWVIPLVMIIAYVLVQWQSKIESNKYRLIFLVIVTAILWLNAGGNTALTRATTTSYGNLYKMPYEVLEIARKISNDAFENEIDRINALFPTDMIPYIRQYDANIHMPFGGSRSRMQIRLWSTVANPAENLERLEELFEMFDDIDYNWSIQRWFDAINIMKKEEINYFVVWKYEDGISAIGNGFSNVAEVGEFYIFRTDTFEIFPTIYDGMDYALVFDYYFYIYKYPDVKEIVGLDYRRALEHFVNIGMPEGRQGNAVFNVDYYIRNYPELLNWHDGSDKSWFYLEFIRLGYDVGRVAYRQLPEQDWAKDRRVFIFEYYITRYPELEELFYDNPTAAAEHFWDVGMALGQRGSPLFDVEFYKERNMDLQELFEDNILQYYLHFIDYGRHEGRAGIERPIFDMRNL